MTPKTLSSALTFFYKFVFSTVWITGFGSGTLALWFGAMHGKGGAPPPPEMKWIFLLVWMIGTGFILWTCAGLKRVRRDGDRLLISNYRDEIAVPLNEVESVTENRWVNIRPVTVVFRRDTAFGRRITFMPTARIWSAWTPHPVVEELLNATRPAQPSSR